MKVHQLAPFIALLKVTCFRVPSLKVNATYKHIFNYTDFSHRWLNLNLTPVP